MHPRLLLLAPLVALLTPSAHAQLFGPPKPKVIATPKPATPTPTPKPKPKRKPTPSPAATSDLPPLPGDTTADPTVPNVAPAPAPAVAPAAKPTPRPRPSAATTAYIATIKPALSLMWADGARARINDFKSGSLSVLFKVDATGKVTECAVTENTSNEAFAKFCEELVRNAQLDAPPARALTNGALEVPFTFTVY